jgi:hypothetical protein
MKYGRRDASGGAFAYPLRGSVERRVQRPEQLPVLRFPTFCVSRKRQTFAGGIAFFAAQNRARLLIFSMARFSTQCNMP